MPTIPHTSDGYKEVKKLAIPVDESIMYYMESRNKECLEIAEFYIPMIVALFFTVWILWG